MGSFMGWKGRKRDLKADGEGFGVDTTVTGVSLKIIRKSISAKNRQIVVY
jgi:hypothetical protein